MSEENVTVVRACYDAFLSGDFPAVLERMDPRIEWADQESLPWGGVHRGHVEFGAHMQAFAGHFKEFRVEPQEFLDAGDRVVVKARFAGRAAREFDVGVVYIWELSDGKVVRVEGYTDSARVLEALGR
jgi:ketosteroid isomerase-like protein